MAERSHMETAIAMAERSDQSSDPKRIPKVGAIIVAPDGAVLGVGSRQADTHAEMDALSHQVSAKTGPSGATVYTTLEPCTPGVRRKPEESCTKRLIDANIKRVVVGMLDPNQDVCGKGVLELQRHNIEVELFPHELAQKVRLLNEEFVRAQQRLGLSFLDADPSGKPLTIKLPQIPGQYRFRCTCITHPGNDIFVLHESRGIFWPQRDTRLRQVPDQVGRYPVYEFDSWFGGTGL